MSAHVDSRITLEGGEVRTSELWKKLVRTEDAWAPALLRVGLGAVMLPHGMQKVLGVWGGGGFRGTMSFFTDVMHIPGPIAFLVIAIEFVGALALIVGAGTRLAAAGIGAVMLGAIATVHAEHGFFVNWFGNQKGEGFEYHLLALAMVGALLVLGGGKASIDRRVAHQAE